MVYAPGSGGGPACREFKFALCDWRDVQTVREVLRPSLQNGDNGAPSASEWIRRHLSRLSRSYSVPPFLGVDLGVAGHPRIEQSLVRQV